MLIRFSVSNYCSFKDEVELNMIPSRERSHPEQVFKPKNKNQTKLLRGAIIYGSNASGKSNLVKAMSYAKSLIIKGRAPNKSLNIPFFKLDHDLKDKPARFEFEIQCNKKMYAYGFELFNTHVSEEWLFEIHTTKNDKMIFERKYTQEGDVYTFGKILGASSEEESQFLNFIAKGTRKNQLFLSESIDRNLKNFEEVYNWFSDTLKIISPNSQANGIEFKISENSTFKDYLTNLLDLADTGINAINTEEILLNQIGDIPNDLIEKIEDDLDDNEAALIADPFKGKRIVLKKVNGDLTAVKLSTTHKCSEGNTDIPFDLEEESDGTRRLIELAPALYEMAFSKDTSVYVIDEIDRSLHPHLTKLLVREHLETDKNSKSQLIMTTHETSLLDVSLLRRDEIWFIQKRKNGDSKLYSLSNFQPRYDKDIRKDYLLGRYGAIPFVGDFKRLNR